MHAVLDRSLLFGQRLLETGRPGGRQRQLGFQRQHVALAVRRPLADSCQGVAESAPGEALRLSAIARIFIKFCS
jgi:hypothetical protein